MRVSRCGGFALTSALAVGAIRPASAQRAAIVGVVRDQRGAPIPLAEAVLVSAKKRDRASDRGWFVLDSIDAGPDLLLVRAIGYRAERVPISLEAADTIDVEVILAPHVQVLPEISVRVS